jgi:hypothetical protein
VLPGVHLLVDDAAPLELGKERAEPQRMFVEDPDWLHFLKYNRSDAMSGAPVWVNRSGAPV